MTTYSCEANGSFHFFFDGWLDTAFGADINATLQLAFQKILEHEKLPSEWLVQFYPNIQFASSVGTFGFKAIENRY